MAKSTQFTSKQRQAIDERYDEMLVSASAGSGKTTVMIERIVALILEGAQLKNMAVATFTKSAATDMRSKLYKRLVLLSNDGNAYAEKQLRALQTAQISTLHSFCQQLIKTYFYAIKTDPDFSILSETDAKVLLSECIEREIEKRLEDGKNDFALIYDVMLQNRKTTALSECINKLYEFASVQPDFDEWIFSATQNIDKHNEHILELKNELEPDFEFIKLQADRLLCKIVQANFVRNQKAAEELCDAVRMRERCNAKAYGKLPDDFYLIDLNNEFSALKKEYNALFDRINEIEQSADPALALPYTKVLLEMTRSVKEEYSFQKQKNGFKDYSDLEHDALKILKNSEVKKQIDAKYLYLFVDEYQDINPLQESIITHFSAKKFFVGDVKQSIYSFRMCTPEIFISKKSRLKDDGKGLGLALELNSNFRSKKGILKFCNEVFSYIMTSDFGGCDYKNEAAFVFSEDEPSSHSFNDAAKDEVAATENAPKEVELFLVSGQNDDTQTVDKVYSVKEHEEKTKLNSLRDAEIHLIISHIANLITHKAGGGAGAEFKDIAILLRSVSGNYAKSLAEALNRNGIPAFLQEKKEATESTAVAALIAFLSLIDNHNDDISLASVMRSPFGGFSDEELAQIKLNYNGSSKFYYDAVKAALTNEKVDASIRARLQRFFDDLERYTFLAYSKNASQILGDVCAEFDYFKYVFARKNGDSAAKELAAFLSFAEESVFKSSVGEFVRALSRQMPKLERSANANAVRIMTIHASKGLEFPHVIMGNLNKEYNLKDLYGTLLLDSKLGAALKVWDLNNHEKLNSSLALRVRSVLKKRLCEEEARILYVALTRAKESLALIASVKDFDKIKEAKSPSHANSFFELLAPQFLKDATKFELKNCSFNSILPQVHIHNKEANPVLVKKIKDYISIQNDTQSTLPVKTVVTKLAKLTENEDDNSFDNKLVGKVNSKAVLMGTAYHALLEKADFCFMDEDKEWERLDKILENMTELADKRTFFLALNKIIKLVGIRKFYREKPFVCKLNAGEVRSLSYDGNTFHDEGKVLVQGVIDLIIEDEDGYCLVDYKSGKIDESLLPSYKKQLALYALATEKILKKPVKQKLIFSINNLSFLEV